MKAQFITTPNGEDLAIIPRCFRLLRRAATKTAHALATLYDVPLKWLMDAVGPRGEGD